MTHPDDHFARIPHGAAQRQRPSGRRAPLYIKKHDSSQILSRKERFFEFEEIKQGNLERECFEENCNDEERLEVFDNHEKDYKVKMIFEVCIKQRIRYLDFDRVIEWHILYIL